MGVEGGVRGSDLSHVKDLLSGLFWTAIDSHFLLRWICVHVCVFWGLDLTVSLRKWAEACQYLPQDCSCIPLSMNSTHFDSVFTFHLFAQCLSCTLSLSYSSHKRECVICLFQSISSWQRCMFVYSVCSFTPPVLAGQGDGLT